MERQIQLPGPREQGGAPANFFLLLFPFSFRIRIRAERSGCRGLLCPNRTVSPSTEILLADKILFFASRLRLIMQIIKKIKKKNRKSVKLPILTKNANDSGRDDRIKQSQSYLVQQYRWLPIASISDDLGSEDSREREVLVQPPCLTNIVSL